MFTFTSIQVSTTEPNTVKLTFVLMHVLTAFEHQLEFTTSCLSLLGPNGNSIAIYYGI
jgi:hypothetical protein